MYKTVINIKQTQACILLPSFPSMCYNLCYTPMLYASLTDHTHVPGVYSCKTCHRSRSNSYKMARASLSHQTCTRKAICNKQQSHHLYGTQQQLHIVSPQPIHKQISARNPTHRLHSLTYCLLHRRNMAKALPSHQPKWSTLVQRKPKEQDEQAFNKVYTTNRELRARRKDSHTTANTNVLSNTKP